MSASKCCPGAKADARLPAAISAVAQAAHAFQSHFRESSTDNALRISLGCDPAFRAPARYALATLALIAGRRVRFVASGGDLHYGTTAPAEGVWLPASPEATALLRRERLALDPSDILCSGHRVLSLFPLPAAPLPTDIIAAAFFFLSLHEEWTAERHDMFGRALASESLLGRRGDIDRPVVAEYARLLQVLLGDSDGARPRFDGHHAAAVMTHDIDYLSKFTPGLLFREVVKNALFNRTRSPLPRRLERLREYLAFRRRDADPYIRSIRRMLAVEQERGITGTWLFKAGGTDKRDVTYSLGSARARDVISTLRAAGQDIGLHPSFNAHTDRAMLAREAARLREAAGGDLCSVRQHYLRFVYPRTWRQQEDEGFTVDSTLGFAEQEGFRNGICHPFLPWDLETGSAISLWEAPLTVMDGTLAHYRGLPPERAADRIGALLDIAAAHGGVAVLLFHNTSYDAHDFPGWGEVFEDAAARMSDGRFLTASLPATVDAWLRSSGYATTQDFLQVINTEPSE